jgi:hypothetical protein
MSEDMLTPTDYQTKCIEWARATGTRMTRVEDLVMQNSDSLDKIRAATRIWAEDFMSNYGMSDWILDDEVNVQESFEGLSLVGSVTLRDPEMRPARKAVSGASISDVQFISPAPPTRDDNDRTSSMLNGFLSRTSTLNPEEGVLLLCKSWVTEDLDGMGIEVPWSEPEDSDREPTEE